MARDYHLIQTGQEVQDAINKIIALTLATPTVPGIMSAEDKRKLDSLGIHYNTTAYWDNEREIPKAGDIIIYSDYSQKEVDGQVVNIPRMKIGSGNGYVQDLPFVDETVAEALSQHIADMGIHTTPQEKQFWNNKLNVNDRSEVVGESLILNRD